MIRNYMENKNVIGTKTFSRIFIIGFFTLSLFFGVAWIRALDQSNDYRRQLDSVRGQLSTATETNRRLADELGEAQSRLEQCHYITEELGDITSRNITTIGECREVIEETRYSIACLAYYTSGCSSDDIYSRIDSWLQSEGINIEEGIVK